MLIYDTYNRLVRRAVPLLGGRLVDHVIDGYHVHSYEIPGFGDGPDVVLLHGLGASGNSFIRVLKQLRSTWRKVHVIDLPGHGFSRLREGQPLLDIRGHQRIFARYIETVIRVPVVLVGNSMGGAIVLKTAIDRPEQVKGLAMISPAGAPLSEAELSVLRDGFRMDSRAKAVDFCRRLTHSRSLAIELIASDMGEQLSMPAVQYILEAAEVGETIEAREIRSLAMPILFIWGVSEKILPVSSLDYFRRVLPSHARVEVLERCGHVAMMEHPNRVVAMLDDLARAVATRAPAHFIPHRRSA